MAKFSRFEEIDAWKKARQLTSEVYCFSRMEGFAQDFALRDQIRKAAVSVISNIAEGFERGGDREFRQFLSIAKGSVGEVRSQLYVALDVGYISNDAFNSLYGLSEEVARMISGLMRYLSESELKGSKFADYVKDETLDSGLRTLDLPHG